MNACARAEGVSLTMQGANRLRVRMRAPYSIKTNGIGARRVPMRPINVPAHCMPIYMRVVSVQSERGEAKRQVMETHIGEHLCREQRECSRNSRPNHSIDSKGRRGKHPTRTGLSTLMIIIAYKNSQICIHEVDLQHKLRSAHASRYNGADIPGTK